MNLGTTGVWPSTISTTIQEPRATAPRLRRQETEKETAGKLSWDEVEELAERAVKELPPRLRELAKQVGVTYGRVTVKKQKTLWGSCSAKGNLNFNCLLMLSVLEEVGNAVTHGVGALFSIAGTVLLLLRSDSGMKLFCSIVYGACLILMFLMSCLYHSFRWGTGVKRLWRRFDYISIYLLIGGTFTPMWLLSWGGKAGIILCAVQWALILTGIT